MIAVLTAAWAASAASQESSVSFGATYQRSSLLSAHGSLMSAPAKPHSSQRRSTWRRCLTSSSGVHPDGSLLDLSSAAGSERSLSVILARKNSRYRRNTSVREMAGVVGDGNGIVMTVRLSPGT